MANAVKHKQKVGPQPGEYARLRVVQGPDSGCIFVLTAPRATMGRGDENDIVLSDLRASRKHAEIQMNQTGAWSVFDLGSANGILLNDQMVREGGVKKGQRFSIGETMLEFQPATLVAAASASPSAMAVGSASTPSLGRGNTQFFDPNAASVANTGVGAISGAMSGAMSGTIAGLGGPAAAGGAKFNPRLLIYAAVIGGLFFLPGEDTKPSGKKSKKSKGRDLASYLPEYEAGKTGPAETFFREGFREYREKNYLRAKTQFETVLQIAPGHRLATIYLRNCEMGIAKEVTDHLVQGKQDSEAGKLKSSLSHYAAVLRLLHRDPQDESFLQAKEATAAIEKAMKGVAKE